MGGHADTTHRAGARRGRADRGAGSPDARGRSRRDRPASREAADCAIARRRRA